MTRVRALLRTAAAPYLHLLALTDHTRKSILREFPGGAPIITRVPLPDGAEAEEEALPSSAQREEQRPQGLAADGDLSVAQQQRQREQQQQQSGGVLEFLYGPQRDRRPGLPGVRSSGEDEDGAGGAEWSLRGAGGEEEGAAASDDLEPPADLPDEVMSRKKKMRHLMAWQKGASLRVAVRRDSWKAHKLDWLVEQSNRLGHITAFLATPHVMFVRNNIMDSLMTDFTVEGDYAAYTKRKGRRAAAEEEEDEDEEGGDGGEEFGVRAAQGDSGEAPQVVVLEGEEVDDLESLLKAIGMIDSTSDDEEEGGEEEEGQDEEEDDDDGDGVVVLADNDDEEEEEEGQEAPDGDDDEDDGPPAVISLGSPSLEGPQSAGPRASQPPSIIIPTTGGGMQDGSQDEMPFNLDMPFSSGPMGWTVTLRVRPNSGGAFGGSGGAGGRGGGFGVDGGAEGLQADAEYMSNMLRLEALWNKQAQAEEQVRQKEQEQLERQEQQPDAGVREQPEASAPDTTPQPADCGGAAKLATGPSASCGQSGPELTPSAPHAAAANGACAGGSVEGLAAQDPTGASGNSLEADWSEADMRAAAAATTTGRARLGPDAAGDLPTDRLVRPAKRPGGVPPAEEPSVGPSSTPHADSAAAERSSAGADGEADPHAAASSSGAADIVASTRQRRGVGVNAGSSDSDAAGPGRRRPTGRARMIRRPRALPRSAGQGLGTSGDGSRSRHADGAEADARPAPSASSADATAQAAPDAEASGSSSGNGNGGNGAADALSIPVYRHVRPPTSASNPPASAAGNPAQGPQHAPGPQHTQPGKSLWGRMGPSAAQGAAPAPPSGSSGGPAGAARHDAAGTAGGGAGPNLPPEAAGYAALGMDELANFVLGRQASEEEKQELARAVAQSAEIEEVFASAGHLFGGADSLSRHRWRRPGTPPRSLLKELTRTAGARRGAVTPRWRRLRIPDGVLSLARRQATAGRQEGQVAEQAEAAGNGQASERAQLDPPKLTLRRLGGRQGVVIGVSQPLGSMPAPVGEASPVQMSQEQLAEAAVHSLQSVSPAERLQVESLMAFLRGRPTPEPPHSLGSRTSGNGGGSVASGAAAAATPLLGRRPLGGQAGLVRGRDAVVVLPAALMQAVAGAWQMEEERLMHPDVLRGRRL